MQIIGAAVGFVGMAVIGSERLAGASLGPFLLVILAAVFWGAGNVLAKSVGKVDMLAFTVWSSLAAPLPLIALSLAVEGTGGLAALAHPGWKLVVSVLALSYGGTLFGYGLWVRLLAHHSAATVAPFALLVPVVGMIAAALLFGETSERGRACRRRSGHGRPRAQRVRRLGAEAPLARVPVKAPVRAVEFFAGVLVMAGLALHVAGEQKNAARPALPRSDHARYQSDPRES